MVRLVGLCTLMLAWSKTGRILREAGSSSELPVVGPLYTWLMDRNYPTAYKKMINIKRFFFVNVPVGTALLNLPIRVVGPRENRCRPPITNQRDENKASLSMKCHCYLLLNLDCIDAIRTREFRLLSSLLLTFGCRSCDLSRLLQQ